MGFNPIRSRDFSYVEGLAEHFSKLVQRHPSLVDRPVPLKDVADGFCVTPLAMEQALLHLKQTGRAKRDDQQRFVPVADAIEVPEPLVSVYEDPSLDRRIVNHLAAGMVNGHYRPMQVIALDALREHFGEELPSKLLQALSKARVARFESPGSLRILDLPPQARSVADLVGVDVVRRLREGDFRGQGHVSAAGLSLLYDVDDYTVVEALTYLQRQNVVGPSPTARWTLTPKARAMAPVAEVGTATPARGMQLSAPEVSGVEVSH